MRKAIALACLTLLLAACARYDTPPAPVSTPDQQDPTLFDYSYMGGELLLSRLTAPLDRTRGILVASFVNIDRLEESSTFGRTVADQYVTFLVNRGYKISEVKLRDNLLVKQDAGEFMLSRNLKTLLQSHQVQAVLVGVYSVAAANVYVTAKLINPVDNVIISAVDYKITMSPDVRRLLSKPQQ